MISPETILSYIRKAMPDAVVQIVDRTGTMDHFRVSIVSTAFEGKNLLDRQRFVYNALDEPMKDGRIHALEIKSITPNEVEAAP
jgi:stress-induced morphogen